MDRNLADLGQWIYICSLSELIPFPRVRNSSWTWLNSVRSTYHLGFGPLWLPCGSVMRSDWSKNVTKLGCWLENTQTNKSQSDIIRWTAPGTSSITSELSLLFSNRSQEKGLKITNSLAWKIVLNIIKHCQMKKNLTSGCCSSFSFSTGLIRSASLAYKIYKRHKLSRVTSTMFTFSITSPKVSFEFTEGLVKFTTVPHRFAFNENGR